MANTTYIDANQFIEMLQAKGLVIVSASEFQLNKHIIRKKMMKRESVTLKEIVDNNLLPLTSKKGVLHWIESGKIHEKEVIRNVGNNNMIRVLTSAIKRLGYAE